jgi:hypothetical protein
LVVDVGGHVLGFLQQLQEDAVAALVALALHVQQRQLPHAIAEETLPVSLFQQRLQPGEDLLADGVEVAQLEVGVDVDEAVHHLQQRTAPQALGLVPMVAEGSLQQQVERVGRLRHAGGDERGLFRAQELPAHEVQRLGVQRAHGLGHAGLGEVQPVLAHELPRILRRAQRQPL